MQNCVCANCAPASTFLIKLAGVQPGGGSIGASATPTKKAARPADLSAMRQLAVIAHRNRGRRQTRGIQIEHRLGLGLIALARVVSLQHQKVGDAERGGAEQLALQGDAISIAARELQDGLDPFCRSTLAATVDSRCARAPAPSVTLTASASPLSGAALASNSARSLEAGGVISAVSANCPPRESAASGPSSHSNLEPGRDRRPGARFRRVQARDPFC